jgi:hypothetical protein
MPEKNRRLTPEQIQQAAEQMKSNPKLREAIISDALDGDTESLAAVALMSHLTIIHFNDEGQVLSSRIVENKDDK